MTNSKKTKRANKALLQETALNAEKGDFNRQLEPVQTSPQVQGEPATLVTDIRQLAVRAGGWEWLGRLVWVLGENQ